MLANRRFLLPMWWLSLLIRKCMAELALRLVTTLPLTSPVVLTLVVPPSVLRRVPLTTHLPKRLRTFSGGKYVLNPGTEAYSHSTWPAECYCCLLGPREENCCYLVVTFVRLHRMWYRRGRRRCCCLYTCLCELACGRRVVACYTLGRRTVGEQSVVRLMWRGWLARVVVL